MREIKFRAKAKFSGTLGSVKWIYSSLMRLDAPTHRLNLGGLDCDVNTLGQFTGLKDINKKDIYEGDIVHVTDGDERDDVCDTGIGKVIFLEQAGLWYIDEKINNGLFDIYQENYIEVIGNIHDAPELLNDD